MATIPIITVDMSLGLLKRKVESLQRKGQSQEQVTVVGPGSTGSYVMYGYCNAGRGGQGGGRGKHWTNVPACVNCK